MGNFGWLLFKRGVQKTIGVQSLYANKPLNPQTWRHDKTPNTLQSKRKQTDTVIETFRFGFLWECKFFPPEGQELAVLGVLACFNPTATISPNSLQ